MTPRANSLSASKPVTVVKSPSYSQPIRKPLTVAIAAAIGGQVIAHDVAAQQTETVVMEEVIVNAARRETTIRELPFNISAVTGDELERQRLARLTDFSRWVPGLTVVDQGPRAADIMTVRGLNVLSIDASELLPTTSSGGTVATYLGDIPLYLDLKMKDIERVEVLLGPQGTLYGAGTLGGAVRYIPTAPDTQNFTFDFTGDLFAIDESSGTGYETDFVVNVPIADGNAAFRASVSYLDDPGFIDYPYLVREAGVSNPQPDFSDPADVAANLYRENDVNTEETISSRLALLWDVTGNVQATFSYYFQNQDVGGRTVNHRDSIGTGNYESGLRFLEPNERESSLFSVEIIADLGFAELTSATGVSHWEEVGQRDQTDLLLDFDYGYEFFPSFAAFTREIADEDTINQELRLVSSGSGRLGWIIGAFYNETDSEGTSEEFVPGYPEFIGLAPPPLPTGDLEYYFFAAEDLTERAVFGELSYQITDRLDFAFGGRFFEYEINNTSYADIPLAGIFSDPETNGIDDDGFLGKLNASYIFNESVTGYATLSEGYRTGSVNAVPPCPDPLQPGQNVCALPDERLIKPDRTKNLELGVHSSFNSGRVLLDAAVYQVDWDDIRTQSVTVNGDQPIQVNGGSAESRGIELAVQVRSGGPWSFQGNYAYNNAELTSDAPGLIDGFIDAFAGDRLPGTPEQQASLALRYDRPLNNGWNVDASWGVTTTSDVLTKVGQRGDGEVLGGFSVHNASVRFSRDNWSATLYADNLTNKFAETGVRRDPSYVRQVAGWDLRRYYRNVIRPRTIGVEFRYSLGN